MNIRNYITLIHAHIHNRDQYDYLEEFLTNFTMYTFKQGYFIYSCAVNNTIYIRHKIKKAFKP